MDCQIRQSLLSTAHVAFEKLRTVVRGYRRVNPHLRTWTTVPVQLHERGTDVTLHSKMTIFCRSLTRAFDLLRQSPPVGRLWTSSGMAALTDPQSRG